MQPRSGRKIRKSIWKLFDSSAANDKRKSSHFRLSPLGAVVGTLLLFVISRWCVFPYVNDHYQSSISFQRETDFWYGRHLVFCVSPGRAGSKYLRNVLDTGKNVISRHEPNPKMNNDILRKVILEGRRNETQKERKTLKLAAIRETLEGTSKDVIYSETNHMFIKTYSDVILEELGDKCKISIIILHRPAQQTVMSQLRLGWFTKGHSGKNVWYYDINDVHPSESKASFKTNSSDVLDSLIGYNADVMQRGVELEREIRHQHEQNKWQNVNTYTVSLKDVSTEHTVPQFLRKLGITVDKERLSILRNQDTNAREVKKDRYQVTQSIDDVASRLEYMSNKLPLLRSFLSR